MPTQVVLVVNLVTAAVLIAAAMGDRVMRLCSPVGAVLALLPLLNGAVLVAYVLGEEAIGTTA